MPAAHPKTLPFAEFAQERDSADEVKQKEEILVILGNPPYDGFAGLAVEEERGLSEAYRTTKRAPAPQGQGLNDLYIRFFRMAERRIAEGVPQSDDGTPGPPKPDARGIVCFISNYSWLDGLSHSGVRERFLEVFDAIRVDCLNGDKYKTGKKTPDGKADPSVFSTETNREGIQVGTAIAMLERWPAEKRERAHAGGNPDGTGADLRFRHWWGKEKRKELEESLDTERPWTAVRPTLGLGLPFVPLVANDQYATWTTVVELLPYSSYGFLTNRDEVLVSIDRAPLEERMTGYFDVTVSDKEIGRRYPALLKSTGRFDAKKTREHLLTSGIHSGEFARLQYRPFDVRWLYWNGETKLVEERRAEFRPHIFPGNLLLAVVKHNRKGFTAPLVVSCFPSHHLIERGANYFPLYLKGSEAPADAHPDLFLPSTPVGPQPNLTDSAKVYLAGLGCCPEDLFFHIVAVLHAPAYCSENAGALRQDWPRIPLPMEASILRTGATLGRQLAALLDPETSVPGVTDMKPHANLKGLGELAVATQEGGDPRQPDLAVEARWGYAGQGGVVMPGPGRISAGTRGEGYVDVHLNGTTRWKDVPEAVWHYSLGGYQVLKKWLSYRERALLGRPLTSDEAQAFTHHIRRITAILTLHDQLDRHYRAGIPG